MADKVIKTPEYWKEERYQPLVEVETIYGNTIKIPKCHSHSWEMHLRTAKEIISKQGKATGLKTIREMYGTDDRKIHTWRDDICEVFLENYQK